MRYQSHGRNLDICTGTKEEHMEGSAPPVRRSEYIRQGVAVETPFKGDYWRGNASEWAAGKDLVREEFVPQTVTAVSQVGMTTPQASRRT